MQPRDKTDDNDVDSIGAAVWESEREGDSFTFRWPLAADFYPYVYVSNQKLSLEVAAQKVQQSLQLQHMRHLPLSL
ncbi:hypothetical protein ACLKA6_007987 [Drosophila palustris]